MTNLLEMVENTIDENSMFKNGDRVCVAASGGPDSTALLHILLSLKTRYQITLSVCHFNHKLRPESDEDELFIQEMADRLDLPFRAEVDLSPPDRSIQKIARQRRYIFFDSLLNSEDADLITTAHTMDDSVETSLMWMLRGVGPTAFGGIFPVRDRFARPLINLRKSQLTQFLESEGIDYRIDKSNETDKYTRNRIRRHIVPAMVQENDIAVEAIARLANMVSQQSHVIDDIAINFLADQVLTKTEGSTTIDPSAARRLPQTVRMSVYRLCMESHGLNPSLLTTKHIFAIDKILLEDSLGKRASLPKQFLALLDHAGLTLGKSRKPVGLEPTAFKCPLNLETGDGNITVSTTEPKNEKKFVEVNMDVMPQDAIFRLRGAGDWLRLASFKGRKKLKKYFIDKKVPSGIRHRLPLLVTGDEVLWVPGYFISPAICAGPDTTQVSYLAYEWKINPSASRPYHVFSGEFKFPGKIF